MFRNTLAKVFTLITVAAQVMVIAIVDFNYDGNPKSDAQVCCMVEHSFPPEPFHECFEAHVNTTDENVDIQTVMCIHQCYYEAVGMFSSGSLQAAKYREYRDTLEPVLREPFTRAIQFCAAFVRRAVERLAQVQKFRCNPVPYLFNRCLGEAGLVNCPQDRWMNSTLCTELVVKLTEKYGKNIQLSTAEKGAPGEE